MTNFQIILVTSIVWMILISFLYYFMKKTNKKKIDIIKNNVIKKNTILNFEKDLEFLFFLMEYKIKNAKTFVFDPMLLTHENAIITESIMDDNTDRMVIEIINMITPDYMVVLSKYFTDETLLVFITEFIFKGISTYVIELNKKKIKLI